MQTCQAEQERKSNMIMVVSHLRLEMHSLFLKKIKNTPKYWQQVKYNMMAKLENIGPFHIFFTISSGDTRWTENFTPYLEGEGFKIRYEIGEKGEPKVTVEEGPDGEWIEMEVMKFLDDKELFDQNKHEVIRQNVLLATRNFHHRVEELRTKVIFGNNNPMSVRHVSYRVEFQGRGAAHVHGVMWLELKEIKLQYVEDSCLQKAFESLRFGQELTANEREAVEKMTDKFTTCTLSPAVAGSEAVSIAKEVQQHSCTATCMKKSMKC